jgi:hypothetical protein
VNFETPKIGTKVISKSKSDIIRQIKSRRMRWAGHVARMGEGRNVYRDFDGKARRKKIT